MSDVAISINGARANTARVRVPFGGRWIVDVDYDGTEAPSGATVITIGALSMSCAVVPSFTGAFLGHVVARVVAGTGGWSKIVSAKSYHDDGGVRRADVLTALARDVGETIDTSVDKTRIGIDFERLAEPGCRTLAAALGSTPWRVDFDGVTRYGARPAAALGSEVELVEFDPRTGIMTLAASDPSSIPIGAVVSDARLGASRVVREVEFMVQAGATRARAWGVAA